MSDTASLKITIDSKDLQPAINRLKALEAQAKKTRKATGDLSGNVDRLAGNARRASAGLDGLAGSSRRASADLTRLRGSLGAAGDQARRSAGSVGLLGDAFRSLKSAVVAYMGVQGIRYLAQVADEATNVRNRLRVVTDSTKELNSTFDDLARVSTESRVSLQTTANLYQRMKMGTEDLGISQDRLVRLTETINKSFKISGATADEASGSIRQLTQAFNANMLRGEELNSINEQAPILMKAIAAETGLSGLALRKFAETGGITAEIMVAAFERIRKEVDEKFGATAKTVEDKMLDIRREFVGMG